MQHSVKRVVPHFILNSLCVAVLLWVFSSSSLGKAVDLENQSITVALTQEPPTLDTGLMADIVSIFIAGHVNEGLVRYSADGNIIPAVAHYWRSNGLQMEFTLRDGVMWSNGSRVSADDFVFAWRRGVSPETASSQAGVFYVLKNGEAINKGLAGIETLGVRAEGANRLIVDLEKPCSYCLALFASSAFFPVNRDFYNSTAGQYGTHADKTLYNGPFTVQDWVHDTAIVLGKNPWYWNAQAVKLNQINIGYITSDNRARLNLFLDGQIALVRLDAETIKDALGQGRKLKNHLTGRISYMAINHDKDHIGSQKDFRRALQLVIDPVLFNNRVISMPGYRPATSFFPASVLGKWRRSDQGGEKGRLRPDAEKARLLLKNIDADILLRPLTLLTVTSPTGVKVAEYFQGLIKQELGLSVIIDQQTLKQYLDKRNKGQFDLCITSSYPEYPDLMTYADILGSGNPNNMGHFKNADYDHWLNILQGTIDSDRRIEAAIKLQQIIDEEIAVIPLVEAGSNYMLHPMLMGVVRRNAGPDPDYSHAWIQQ